MSSLLSQFFPAPPPPPPPPPPQSSDLVYSNSTRAPRGRNGDEARLSSSRRNAWTPPRSPGTLHGRSVRRPTRTRTPTPTSAAPPPPPPPRGVPTKRPNRPTRTTTRTTTATSSSSSSSSTQRIRQRQNPPPLPPRPPPPRRPPPPPPPPPPPRVSNLVTVPPKMSGEDLASKALDMFHKCLNRSIPTGNLYSGGLGAYYLLLEHSRYNLCLLKRQEVGLSKTCGTSHDGKTGPACQQHHSHTVKNTPFRCKRLLKQALEGAREASNRFKRSNSATLSHQRGCISLLGGEWIGSHALLAVCYRRLEDFQENYEPTTTTTTTTTQEIPAANEGEPRSPGSARSLCSPRSIGGFSSNMSISSYTIATATTTASAAKKPRSERLVDRILYRLEKQHLFNPDLNNNNNNNDDEGTIKSNATASTVLAVWNQDVLSGRAGGLQTIFWLRSEFGRSKMLGRNLAVSLAVKILEEGLSTAASLGLNNYDNNYNNNYSDNNNSDNDNDIGFDASHADDGRDDTRIHDAVLFWVCDSNGSLKAYLGAARGVVGIIHTLLGLHSEEWELIEEEIPNAQKYLRNTIDAFLPDPPLRTNRTTDGDDCGDGPCSNRPGSPALYQRLVYNAMSSSSKSSPAQTIPGTTSRARQKFTPKSAGNLRPLLDASCERDTTVDWFHGATGLAMMLVEAAKVYRSKEYLKEAHRLCDAIIFPRGLREQKIRTTQAGVNKKDTTGRNSRMSSGSSSTSASTSSTNGGNQIYNKKGPVGLAGMALCFLQLSRLCSNNKEEEKGEADDDDVTKISLPANTSLKELWESRAVQYAQHAHQEWTNYIESIPTTTGVWNAFSLYEGMGGAVSLLWQLSLSMFLNDGEVLHTDIEPIFQLPLYSASCMNYNPANHGITESLEPILLSSKDITFLATPASAPKFGRTQHSVLSHEQALAESRRRRAAAEAKAQRRAKAAEEAELKKAEYARAERAVMNARRKAELEARKNAQLLARKRALDVAKQKEEEESLKKLEKAEKKREEDKIKREALLLARKQAKERVDALRKAKEEAERVKAEEEAKLKAIEAEKKIKAAEQEARKRRAMLEARLRRQAREAEIAKRLEEERKSKEASECLRRAEELKQKEELRKQRYAEMLRRKQKAAEIAKEEERQRLVREALNKERCEAELQRKEEERKRQETERRRRLLSLKQRQTKEEQEIAAKRAMEAKEREATKRRALEAREKRLRELHNEKIKKQRVLQEQRLRDELQRALDKEVEKQRREERLRLQAVEERKFLDEREQKAVDACEKSKPVAPKQTTFYSPSFVERKKMSPTHFSVPTRSSLFWTLQTDSKIGSSENYRPALVVSETRHPSNGDGQAVSHFPSLSSSPGPNNISSISIPSKDAHDEVLSSRTSPTAPLSTATEQANHLSTEMTRN